MDRYSLEIFGYPSVNVNGGWVRYDDITPLLSKIEELTNTAEVTDKAIDLIYTDHDIVVSQYIKKIEEQNIRIMELFFLYEETRLIKDSWITRATILAAVFFVEQLFVYYFST
jgi:hypothetical protein